MSRPAVIAVATAVVVGGVAAFVLLDVVLAAALVALAATVAAMVVAASGWESHPTFEQRELERARRRRFVWDRNADARAKDRARWEAYQARQAQKASQTGEQQ